ncbi:hypothetical protein ElyMa_001156400, partial [Elysia marginata]
MGRCMGYEHIGQRFYSHFLQGIRKSLTLTDKLRTGLGGPAVVEQLLKELEERVDNLEKKYRDRLLSKR